MSLNNAIKMTTEQLRSVILEAVDCLRQRKCRPDRESIAVFVMRKLGSSMNEIFSEIENIVDQGSLLKVEYKGSTSYRSPKNFDLKNSPLLTKHSKILNSSKTTRYVISGMNELLSTFPNYAQEGVPLEELKKKLVSFDAERFAESGIKVIFEREEAAGNIQVAQLKDDTQLYPIRVFPKDLQVPENMKSISFMENTNPPPETKSKKRGKKSEAREKEPGCKVGVTVARKTPQKNNAKKKKQEIVYAVKSDPDKLLVTNNNSSEDSMKAKAEQMGSISLKVVMGKTSKVSKAKEREREEMVDIKPDLALVKIEVETTDDNTGEVQMQNSNGMHEGSGGDVVQNHSTSSKAVKRKSGDNSAPTGASKLKKQKLNSSTAVAIKLSVSKVPPRYTYSSRRRIRYSYDDEDNRSDRSGSHSKDEVIGSGSPNGYSEICVYCHKEENFAGQQEDFLLCGTCNAKIHPTCIDYSEDHARRLRMNSKASDPKLQWQCFSCKRCGVCQKDLMCSKNDKTDKAKGKNVTKKEQRYVLCDRCDRGYHANCIKWTLPAPMNDSSWYCSDCEETSSNDENGSTTTASPKKSNTTLQSRKKVAANQKGRQESQNTNEESTNASNNNGSHSGGEPSDSLGNDKDFPDISKWTTAQVQKYFIEKGLREEAASLKEQEIDGMSLLLLRRADVIFGLNLRLGPALKIYRLVCQLQQHSPALKKNKDNNQPAKQARRPND